MNTNGVISFSVPVSQFTPDRFSLRDKRGRIAEMEELCFTEKVQIRPCYRERLESFAGRLGQLGFL